MTTHYYLGVAEPGSTNWSISFPSFPGVVTVGDSLPELMAHAPDALASAIAAMAEDGATIPPDTLADPASADFDPRDYDNPRAILVPVTIGSPQFTIDLAIDEGLLIQIDTLSQRTHASRSDLLARGARLVLASEAAETR